jgi:hypothetical protein
LAFIFIGSTIGVIFVVGFQLLRKDEKYGRWTFRFMTPITIFVAASGVGALAVALYSGRHGPAAWLFLACGVGALLGLWVCRLFQQRRATVAPSQRNRQRHLSAALRAPNSARHCGR